MHLKNTEEVLQIRMGMESIKIMYFFLWSLLIFNVFYLVFIRLCTQRMYEPLACFFQFLSEGQVGLTFHVRYNCKLKI